MELPFIITYWVTWASLIGGIYVAFNYAGESVNESAKRSTAIWLQNVNLSKDLPNWPQAFTELFDTVFTKKHWSWTCFWRSLLVSVVGSLLILIILVAIREFVPSRGNLEDLYKDFFLGLIATGCLINIVSDYFSLLQTRIVLSLIIRSSSRLNVLFLLVFDVLLTAIIFVVAWSSLMTLYFLSYDVNLIAIQDAFAGLLQTFDMMYSFSIGIYLEDGVLTTYVVFLTPIITTFFTSIWLWLYAASGFLLKLLSTSRAGIKFLRDSLDITNKPFNAMGFTLMLLVTIVYLVWGVVMLAT